MPKTGSLRAGLWSMQSFAWRQTVPGSGNNRVQSALHCCQLVLQRSSSRNMGAACLVVNLNSAMLFEDVI